MQTKFSLFSFLLATKMFNTTTATPHNNDTRLNITSPARSDNAVVVYKELQLAFMLVLIITGLFVNTMLIALAVYRKRYLVLTNMAVSNYIAIIVLSLRVVNLTQQNGEQQPCILLLAITELWWTTQNYTLLVISYQRYKPISNPFRAIVTCYERRRYVIAAVWLVATLLILILVMTDWVTYKYDAHILRCRKNWEAHPWYTLLYSFVSFIFPGSMLIYFQGYMFYKGYRIKKMETRSFSTTKIGRSWSFSSVVSLRGLHRLSHQSESLPSGRRLGSFSTQTSSDFNGNLSIRKRKIADSTLKPLFSTLLIVVPYVLTAGPEIVLMFLYYGHSQPSQEVDVLMRNTKYLIITCFPIIFCANDTKVRKDIRTLTNRLVCCRSKRIKPHLNIDSRDYKENIERRDGRRSSTISQQINNNYNNTTNNNNSNNNININDISTDSAKRPRVKQESRNKSSPQVGNISPNHSDTMTHMFFINNTPINVPAVEA